MTEKEIMQYTALVKLAERKRRDIERLESKDISVVSGKVVGSSANFPYTEVRTTVQMYEPREMDVTSKRIKELKDELVDIELRKQKIERFITTIQDPELKVIFEMRVYDKKNWYDIAAELDEDKSRTTYSRKFKNYIENAHNARKAQMPVV